jgi:hypothetical protein
MRAQAELHRACLDHQRKQNEREKQYMVELKSLIEIEEAKAQMIASIEDPALRRKIASQSSFLSQTPLTTLGVNSSGAQYNWRQVNNARWERA